MERSVPVTRKVSPFLLAVTMIALCLSLISIYLGINMYFQPDIDQEARNLNASLYIGVGAATLSLSTYMLYMTRRRVLKLVSMEMQPLSTTLICQKCGLRNVRDFQKGDFVFKQADEACPKDNEKMVISAIYREVKEKGKEDNYS